MYLYVCIYSYVCVYIYVHIYTSLSPSLPPSLPPSLLCLHHYPQFVNLLPPSIFLACAFSV